MRNQSGFTLIELVLVIIILGILAAVAVPKFINLSSEAETAALQGTVGAIDSASAINYAAYQVSASKAYPIISNTATCSTAIDGILQEPLDPTKYSTTTTVISTAAGLAASCVVTQVKTSATKSAAIIVTN